ncbi:MAG: hypothetical protein J6Y28_09895 [Acholeplasmatales bacterium]|nr:hypothetical protein [Methanobrevibacter sp.]MBP5446471.1 hypothetical protein [Acholeplasmatales bacterium]
MKLVNKISFGVIAIQAGQKSSTVNAEPRLIANSTPGKFVITAPVSKAMNIAVGENIQFGNNIAGVENAISQRVEDIVNWASENGVDLNTREGQDAALKEFTVWFIFKGVPQYDSKGNPLMTSERYTKEDKQEYINNNAATILAENRDLLIERNGGQDADDETLIALISVDDIESPKRQSISGAKTATTAATTGVGCQLNFTDSSIWNTLKSDLGENKSKKNRIYKVLLDEVVNIDVPNGKENVTVPAYPIEFLSDEAPIVREKA